MLNISNNTHNGGISSIKSLISVANIENMSISSVGIMNNLASQYMKIDGESSGDLNMIDTRIIGNENHDIFINTLIEINNFKADTRSHSNFTNKNNGSNLFVASFDGNLDITNVEFINNNINNTLIELKGISTLAVMEL